MAMIGARPVDGKPLSHSDHERMWAAVPWGRADKVALAPPPEAAAQPAPQPAEQPA